ncbi:MAG TPA: IPTL-CTERM sorting domain-containing protein, partial [Thermoanaerobaculia bacterium]|nr:IPTL-CTERM sorting domain-containing protein [Thermoanaerobaculia bacterium]
TIIATIDPGVAAGTTLTNQGTIAYDADGNGTNEATAMTDDPATAGTANPTVFQVGPIVEPPPIPTLDTLGLALLALLLAIGGAALLQRRVDVRR